MNIISSAGFLFTINRKAYPTVPLLTQNLFSDFSSVVEQPNKKNPKQGFTFPRNFGGPKSRNHALSHEGGTHLKISEPTRFSNGFFDTNPKPCNVKDGKFLWNCQQHLLHSFIVNWNIHRPTSPHYWVSVWARKHKKRNVSPAWTLLFTWLLVAVMCNNDSREDKAILKKGQKRRWLRWKTKVLWVNVFSLYEICLRFTSSWSSSSWWHHDHGHKNDSWYSSKCTENHT